MAGDDPQAKIEELLGTETPFRSERRAYQPRLCPALAAGAGSTRPLAGFDLEVLKVAQEQLPFVSQNKLVEIVPDGRPSPGGASPAHRHRPLRRSGPGRAQRHRRSLSRPPSGRIPTAS